MSRVGYVAGEDACAPSTMVFVKSEEVVFMESRLRRWLVPAIAAELVLTGIVVD